MDSKLWIGVAVVLGLLLLAFGGLRTDRDRDVDVISEARGELVDAGRFVVEIGGRRVLEETYTLFFQAADGYMLLSQGVLTTSAGTVSLAQQTQYDRDFRPFFYHLGADTPSGSQIISMQAGISGLTMEVRVGSARQSAEIPDGRNVALLDNSVIGHYAVLLAAARAEAIDRSFTAAIPQALLSIPARLDGPNSVELVSGGRSIEGKAFDLRIGDTRVTLIEVDRHLVGMVNRAQGSVGWDAERFPDGLSVVAEAPSSGPSGAETYLEREIAFASGDLTLVGTLTLPLAGERPFPAALFLHGSGPIDRDGNAQGMEMDAYRQLAHVLAEAGVASLRFDKRGVGESDGISKTASRDDLLADARAALEALREQPEVDPTRCILVGHSEGAYLAPALAVEDPSVAGLVLLAGAARPLGEITRWQVETLLRLQGATDAQVEVALAQQDQYTEFVTSSAGEWDDYSLDELRTAMPWLTEESAAQLAASPLALSWLREHYRDDPEATLSRIGSPVLAINGEKDLQVPAAEGERIRSAVLNGGRTTDVTARVLPDLNHLLRHHPEEPNLVYRHLDEPVDARVLEAVTDWAVERLAR